MYDVDEISQRSGTLAALYHIPQACVTMHQSEDLGAIEGVNSIVT